MKKNCQITRALLLLLASSSSEIMAAPLGTAFTYQGRLAEDGQPANGVYDLRFVIYDAASGGSAVAGPITNSPVAVSNGLFATTLDFGEDVFIGDARWLEVGVRSNRVAADFAALSTRQSLTPSPYALYAPNAGGAALASLATSAAAVAANGVANASLQANAVTSDKIADGTIAPADLSPTLASNTFWRLGGNTGTTPGTHFLGTTDSQPLEIKVGGRRALRIEADSESPRLIGGHALNSAAGAGATVGGGGSATLPNRVDGNAALVAGGEGNTVVSNAHRSVIVGGRYNRIEAAGESFIGGGALNWIGPYADQNVLGGGYYNRVEESADANVLGGGEHNTIELDAQDCVVAGGYNNTIEQRADNCVVAGGYYNRIVDHSHSSSIGGGGFNWIHCAAGTISGGIGNLVDYGANSSTIGGGGNNTIQSNAVYATIVGGCSNTASGPYSLAAGQRARASHAGTFVWADTSGAEFASTASNQFLIRASGGVGINTGAPRAMLDVASGDALVRGASNFMAGTDARLNLGDDNNYVRAVWGEGLRLGVWQGVDALALNNGGNVGIGLTNPASKLHVAGTVTAAGFSGNGAGLTALSGTALITGSVSESALAPNAVTSAKIADGAITTADVAPNAFWKASGNAGTTAGTHFLGTTDNMPLELRVNGLRGLRLEDNGDGTDPDYNTPDGAPNVIGGAPNNQVAAGVVGATISGGGALNWSSEARPNIVGADYATIGGGLQNTIRTRADTANIGGGAMNTIQSNAWEATISGGVRNTIQDGAARASVGGGEVNVIQAYAVRATIGGGAFNSIQDQAQAATIAGGHANEIGTNATYSSVGGGALNRIQTNAWHATIAGGFGNVASGHGAFVGGGGHDGELMGGNAASGAATTISGGVQNRATWWCAAVGGGFHNSATDGAATVAGGFNNTASRFSATVGGGLTNIASGFASTVGGGADNTASDWSTVGGGLNNSANLAWCTVGGGVFNSATNDYSTVPGGARNTAGGKWSLAAGRRANALHDGTFVWADSTDADFASTTSNQFNLRATGGVRVDTGTATGISLNAADRALLTCGWNPFTSGTHSGQGRWGMVMEPHTLALGMPALGGKTVKVVKYNEDSSYTSLMTVDQGGTVTATAFNPTSDRNAKENFEPVNSREVLEKVAAMPISRWNFKGDAATPHLGPMAQDFHAAFGLGTDDKHIATVDGDGVALAAIQGLNQKVESGKQNAEGRMESLEAENAALRARLARLEELVQQLIK